MAIAANEIEFYKSTGGLGGAITGDVISSGTIENLFDNVTSAEATAGDIEYRCFYVKNSNAADTLTLGEIFINTNTPSADSDVSIALDPAGVNGDAVTIANESAIPDGPVFSQPLTGSALSLGSLGPSHYYPIWVRRNISVGAAAINNDNVQLTVRGDSPA